LGCGAYGGSGGLNGGGDGASRATDTSSTVGGSTTLGSDNPFALRRTSATRALSSGEEVRTSAVTTMLAAFAMMLWMLDDDTFRVSASASRNWSSLKSSTVPSTMKDARTTYV